MTASGHPVAISDGRPYRDLIDPVVPTLCPLPVGRSMDRCENPRVQQRFLTDNEIADARAMIGWQFWFGPIVFSLGCMGTAWVAATGEPVGIWLFVLFSSVTIVLWTLRLRRYKKFSADIEHRTVDVLEGAPQEVWVAGRTGDCYLQISGHTIKVPTDCYGALKDASIVKVAFLPTSKIAVRVDTGRGIGLS